MEKELTMGSFFVKHTDNSLNVIIKIVHVMRTKQYKGFKMRKTVKLTESSIRSIVRKLIKEQIRNRVGPSFEGWMTIDEVEMSDNFQQQIAELLGRRPKYFIDGDNDDYDVYGTIDAMVDVRPTNFTIIEDDNDQYGRDKYKVTVIDYDGVSIAHCFDMISPMTYDFYVA